MKWWADKTLHLWRRSCWGSEYVEHPKALNNDQHSNSRSTTVKELCEIIWNKIKPNEKLSLISDTPYTHDVQKRIPDVQKAKDLLGFSAKTTLEEALDEIIPWVKDQVEIGEM